MTVTDRINDLQIIVGITKHQRIVQGIITAIDEKIIGQGDQLPSVNQMVSELQFARKTIVKAYAELKERGIIEPKNRMGYYVSSIETQQQIKIMLLLYAFDIVQQTFYKNFRLELGDDIQVDAFFHHNNLHIYKKFITDHVGKYGLYIVAPIHDQDAMELLHLIPPNKMLVIDRHEEMNAEYSMITQRFEEPLYEALCSMRDEIKKFDKFIIFYRSDSDFPVGTYAAFQRFVKVHDIAHEVIRMHHTDATQANCLYYTINDADLWELLKDCQRNNFKVGKDIGIISQDETPVKELISGGITTISTDFRMMAQKSAQFVLNREYIREIIPTNIIRRNSF